MNPQSISSSFLIATGHVRAMRGGAQSHMLTASDGHAYVVKFANNPQSVRVLANEWIASSIGRALGLTIPEPAILSVPEEFVDRDPSLVIRLVNSTVKCSPGPVFGSRIISGLGVVDYLPESALHTVENLEEFAGVFALDKWLCNCDGRQAVFCRKQTFRAHFIDFGYCFNAEEWCFPDSPLRGVYPFRRVYDGVCRWQSFQPWLSRIENFRLSTLRAIAAEVPLEWARPEALLQLIERIDARRARVRELIAEVHRSPHNPFGMWNQEEP
jgi:hypothetical protein